ncbi:MAG: hypothetical protein K1X36_11790 [Pyrinomonadaceae bacterium]|nr:hypothetical protein [Pyrinomonadaceae bacterium]
MDSITPKAEEKVHAGNADDLTETSLDVGAAIADGVSGEMLGDAVELAADLIGGIFDQG